MAGHVKIAGVLDIEAEVQFRLELAGSNAGIELIVNGSMNLAPIGNVALINSGFRINAQGLVARINLTLGSEFGHDIGLSFNVTALLSLNTTGSTQTLGSSTVDPGFCWPCTVKSPSSASRAPVATSCCPSTPRSSSFVQHHGASRADRRRCFGLRWDLQ